MKSRISKSNAFIPMLSVLLIKTSVNKWFKSLIYQLWLYLALFLAVLPLSVQAAFLNEAQARVAEAIEVESQWSGPTKGPAAGLGKNIIFIASDLRNGGVNGVAKGVSEAIGHLDWNLRFLDGAGSETRQGAAIRKAIGFLPDGIVLGGIDAKRHSKILQAAKELGITVIGWHALPDAKGDEELGVFTNITTDIREVAEIAALLSVVEANGYARVVIFTDPNYTIALSKSDRMAEVIRECLHCELISIEHVPLDKTAEQMPQVVGRLLKEHKDITHFLTINDLYIDFAIPSIESEKFDHGTAPISLSAGDGSSAAFQRIREGVYQGATVAEPLLLHGWQIVDEFNRAFLLQKPSGYSAAVHLVTDANIDQVVNSAGIYDPPNEYRESYLDMWKK